MSLCSAVGRVKVSIRRRSREVILAVLDPGSLLGEVSAIDGGSRSATVVALEPVEVDVTSFADFREFLDEHPRVAGELLQLVVARLRDTSLRQVEFGTVDTLGRLCVGSHAACRTLRAPDRRPYRGGRARSTNRSSRNGRECPVRRS